VDAWNNGGISGERKNGIYGFIDNETE